MILRSEKRIHVKRAWQDDDTRLTTRSRPEEKGLWGGKLKKAHTVERKKT